MDKHLKIIAFLNICAHKYDKNGIKELLKDFKTIKIKEIETTGRWLIPVHYSKIAKK